MIPFCTIGITGFSGSGKTTLIRKIVPELKKQGLSVGVLKHIHHKLNIDIRGKDTDHFFRAGADFVLAHDAAQGFARYRSRDEDLRNTIDKFPSALDLIIIEGHKEMNLPGIWLEKGTSKDKTGMTCHGDRKVIFRDDVRYQQKVLAYVREELEKFHSARPLLAGLLIGGKSARMGTPKALLRMGRRTLAGKSFDTLSAVSEKVVLLGSGQIPGILNSVERLSDVSSVEGPLAGILSAFRWAPESAWVISSVDMPFMRKEAWKWLLDQRKPGIWAVLPKIKGSKGVETTGAVYEPMIFDHVESLARRGNCKLQDITEHPKVITPVIPTSLAGAWRNVNTPADWEETVSSSLRQR